MLRSILLAATLLLSPSTRAPEDQSLTQRFEALDAAGDRAGIVELWRAHPYEALSVVDSYLEGSLAAVEVDGSKPCSAEVSALHERALRGARAADEAFGSAIFGDYAASFAGWSAAEGVRFRSGQKAFGDHRAAMKAGQHERALGHARTCVELAEPLGDWWGTAMGLGGMGAALQALGRDDEALVPLSRARLLNHELGLAGSEYGNLRTLVDALVALGKTTRAQAAVESALALAEILGDAAGRTSLAKTKLDLEQSH